MILIADSGSTKTDWALVDNHQAVKEIKTQGLNPFQVSGEQIAAEIRSALLPHLPTTEVDAVYFTREATHRGTGAARYAHHS